MSGISGVTSSQAIQSSQDAAMGKSEAIKQKLDGGSNSKPESMAFSDRLEQSLNSVAEAQNKAAQSVRDYELGREQDLSKVMIDQQISSLGFQLTLNVRNKALSAYKEIMNMPV